MRYLWIFIALIACTGSYAEQSISSKHDDGQRQASGHKKPAKWFVPLLHSESEKSKKEPDSVDPYKKEAEERQIQDLAAQKGMNSAAQKMERATQRLADDTERLAGYTWWMMAASIAASALLIPTLIATTVAAFATKETLKETRRVNTLQLQPWLSVDSVEFNHVLSTPDGVEDQSFGHYIFAIEINVKNEGKTPAKAIEVIFKKARASYSHKGRDEVESEIGFIQDLEMSKTINPNRAKSIEFPAGVEKVAKNPAIFEVDVTGFIFEFLILFRDDFTPEGGRRRINVKATLSRDVAT